MKNKINFPAVLLLCALLCACAEDKPRNNPFVPGDGYMEVQLATDKAAYAPGEVVKFSLKKMLEDKVVNVRYKHLNELLKEEPLTTTTWQWTPPSVDFQGYLVDLYSTKDGVEVIHGSIAVDVSSSPTRFPRNGFLSKYGQISQKEIEVVMNNLNRHHINYVQYQDWHYKHHQPLAGSSVAPMSVWKDIINRDCYRATVQGYIDASHQRGMQSLFYNLAYGALNDAAADGVQEEWYVYKDNRHTAKDLHPLGAPFKSSIYLLNSGNSAWQNYIAAKNDDLYKVFDFDGYQIDQLGNRGTVYDYNGVRVDLAASFRPFIEAMKRAQPTKRLVMNAVSQYGQEQYIAPTDVDFLYTEVWKHDNSNGFDLLANVIQNNDRWSNGKRTVVAAYLNYNHGKKGSGTFNTPGILMASAAIHAWGGAHLQLGEHMLCNEYFPNNNLSMDSKLTLEMIHYYDFITAYENLLRDGGDFVGIDAVSTDAQMTLNPWKPIRGQVATIGKQIGKRTVVHLLNYKSAVHLDWCDTDATQQEPKQITDAVLEIHNMAAPVRAVWAASPDHNEGVAAAIPFQQEGTTVKITLPALKYWSMVVLEGE